MTVLADRLAGSAAATRSPRGRRSWIRRELPWIAPSLAAAANAAAFAIIAPNVNDIFAAIAREYAVLHGVGLKYWFGWFGGGATPGNYSVITPYLSAAIGAVVLAAVATAAITPTAWLALRDTPHAVAAMWVTTLTFGLNLWSGRVPFALGSLMGVLTVVFLMRRRTWLAAGFAILSVAASPVAGVFVLIGLSGVFLTRPEWRRSCALVAAPIGVSLICLAILYGQPGPESFTALQLLQLLVAALAFLHAAPPPWLRTTIWVTILAAPVVFLVPNGLGDNLLRLVAYCLPAVVVATSRRRLVIALVASLVALSLSTKQSVGDVFDGATKPASPAYYTSLSHELTILRTSLRDCRLEIVEDGTHTAAYALLAQAMLARGYEYQEDNALNAVLTDPDLDAVGYKLWLDNNAVCYVAIASSHRHAASPEFTLVSTKRPAYLARVWGDESWTLYRVANPNPIVAPPVRVVRFSQSVLVLNVPCACSFLVRVRNPQNLKAVTTPPAGSNQPQVAAHLDDDLGWTKMTTTAPGVYTLSGRA